jgi:cytochrome c oxidase cbb3-type subunit 4
MLAGIVTIVSLVAFLAGVAWAMSGKRTREFDEAARLPLEDGDDAERTVRRQGDAPAGGDDQQRNGERE